MILSFISSDKPNCHFERAKRVEKSKSRKYNKYPVPIHENRHFHGQKKTAQSCLIREEGAKLRYKISFFMSEAPAVAPGAIVIVALPV